ncbi:MAG: hypothetical protein J0H49_38035 [Acidobacteria bacterium]|nr:hypothetical protein [Acidobacteriota bacterium]
MSSRRIVAAGWRLCLCLMAGSALLAGQTIVVRAGRPRSVVVAAPVMRPVVVSGAYRWHGRTYVWVSRRRVVPPSAVWVTPGWGYVPVRRPRVIVSATW